VQRWWVQQRAIKECLIIKSGWAGFKIGLQGTTIKGEGPRVKLYVLEIFWVQNE